MLNRNARDLMQGRQETIDRPSTTIHHNLRDEAGQTLILFALSLVVLCGFLGLAIDVGMVRATRIKLQEAADAAALAGALEVNNCDGAANCQGMQFAARAAMAENGLNGSALQTQVCSPGAPTTLTLTLNNGPCVLANDPNFGKSQYVEAVVSEQQPAYFARVFGLNSFNVSARGEAMGSPAGCFYNLGRPGKGSLTLVSGAHLDATNCAIFDDGDLITNGGAHEQSTLFDYYGSWNQGGGIFDPAPTQAPPVSDPVRTSGFPTPPTGSCTTLAAFNGSSATLGPGYYCGITVDSGGRLTLTGGTYYLSGDFVPKSGSRVDGTAGVTIVFLSGSYNGSSGSRVDFSAQTSGPYTGIVMYQVASDTKQFVYDSGNGSTWQGIFYVPGAAMDINSGGDAKDNVLVVAYSTVIDSGAKLKITQDWSWLPNGSPLKYPAVLVE
jgi:Flp pilus assembly protein TadG